MMKQHYTLFLTLSLLISVSHPAVSGSFLQNAKNPFAPKAETSQQQASQLKSDEVPYLLQDLTFTEIMTSENSFSGTLDFSQGQNAQFWSNTKLLAFKFTLDGLYNLEFSTSNIQYQGNYTPTTACMIYFEDASYRYYTLYSGSAAEIALLGAGTYYILLNDDYYHDRTETYYAVDFSISKRAIETTPLTFPVENTITFTEENTTNIYSFSVAEPFNILDISFTAQGNASYNIYSSSFNNIDGNYGNNQTEKSRIFEIGEYYIIVEGDAGSSASLNIDSRQPESITIPYDEDITMEYDYGKGKIVRFNVNATSLVTITLDSENFEYSVYDSAGDYYGQDIFEPGDYYLNISAHDVETNQTHLKIDQVSASNAHPYTEIDYSKTFSTGKMTTGNMDFNNHLTFVDISGYDLNADGIIDENDNQRAYLLATGYTLHVEAGNIYHFSGINISDNRGYVQAFLLKNTLTGDLFEDIILPPADEEDAGYDYIPSESGVLKILLSVSESSYKDMAYSLRVDAKSISNQVFSFPDFFENQATDLPYSNTLSYAETFTIDPEVAPYVNIPTSMGIGLHFNIPVHAAAFRVIMPENNSGLNIDLSTGFMPYIKEGDEYIPLYQDDDQSVKKSETPSKIRKLKSMEIPAGEYYLLCVGDQPILTEPFTFYIKAWTDEAEEPATPVIPGKEALSVKDLLDNESMVTTIGSLPFTEVGTITNTDPLTDIYDWNGEYYHVKAWKLVKTEDNNVNINFAGNGYCNIYIPDGEGGYTLTNNWPYAAGVYYIIAFREGDEDEGSYVFRIWGYDSMAPEVNVVQITSNTTDIYVPENVTNNEISLYLADLSLNGTMNIGGSINLDNSPSYWDIAEDGNSATTNKNINHSGYFSFANNVTALTVNINRISGTKDTDSKMWIYSHSGKIYINNAVHESPVLVSDIAGRTEYAGKVTSSQEEINVPHAGIYIVRSGGYAVKVIVR